MRNLGKILHPKDITTKEYVDQKCEELDNAKVNTTDIEEYSSEEVSQLWEAALASANSNSTSK